MSDVISEEEKNEIQALIKFLESRDSLSDVEREEKYRPYFLKALDKMKLTGLTYGEVTGSPGMFKYNSNNEEFRKDLKKIDNDLIQQLKIVKSGVEHYFSHGEIPPPYYALRVAIILRKNKCYELEVGFLEAFTKKFFCGVGEIYKVLNERVIKARLLSKKHK